MTSIRTFQHALVLSLGCVASSGAIAGVACQMMTPDGADIGAGGSTPGAETGDFVNSLACGRDVNANAASAVGIGANVVAGTRSVSIGTRIFRSGSNSVTIGTSSETVQPYSVALGVQASAMDWGTLAVGAQSRATGSFSSALGYLTTASGTNSSAFGNFYGTESTSIVERRWTRATGDYSVAFGNGAGAMATRSSALGTDSAVHAGADNAVALGVGSHAVEADTVSLGHSATDIGVSGNPYGSALRRRVVNLADGINDNDAASVGQLRGFATALGGGASWAGGVLTAPSYTVQGTAYSDVGSALGAVDGRLTQLGTQLGGPANGVAYDDASGDAMTLRGATGTRISNVADGQDAGDAVNKGQMDAGDARTLADANAHADSAASQAQANAIAHADAGDANTLAQANDHADAGDARTLQQATDHADAGDARTLQQARDHADAGDARTLQEANDYADTGDARTLQEANDYADTGDARTLQQANTHADTAAEQARVSANAYTDATAGQAMANASAHADAGDARTLQAATAHADASAGVARAEAIAHADAGDARTLASSNTYTDTAAAQTLQSANTYTDTRLQQLDDDFGSLRRDTERRIGHLDRRIDRIAAMGGAMAAAAMNTAGLAGDNRLGVGVGAQGGQSALAVGYQRLLTPRASMSLSAGFSGDERSVSAGAGFSW